MPPTERLYNMNFGDKMRTIKTMAVWAACCMLVVPVSCSRDLDLAGKYDNTESSKPYEEEDISDDYTEYGDYFMTGRRDINVNQDIPRRSFWLDGKITAVKFSWASKFTLFWSADDSYMQEACETPWLENNINGLTAEMAVIGKNIQPTPGFSDGGQWFIGVHELPGEKLVGFFHSESHWPGSGGAFKSIGVAYSSDHGHTWTAGEPILMGTDPKPETGPSDNRSYGLGDGCVVWNEERESWICYYSGYCPDKSDFVITMAESKDEEGRPGTWRKWDGTDFTVEGCNGITHLGGINTSIAELSLYHGGNPSVMYNTWLNKWLMVWHSWQRTIVYSTSDDGISWEKPAVLLGNGDEPGGAMYPNLIGPEGDVKGGQNVRLYYASDMQGSGRTLSVRRISFK